MCDYARMSCKKENSSIILHPIFGEMGICDDCGPDFDAFIEEYESDYLDEEE